jgi:opine dehydrogenase
VAVARAFGHELPSLLEEMEAIGTVEAGMAGDGDFRKAIASGRANEKIRAPDSFTHRYYREDFGFGLVPFVALAGIAGVETPVAAALLEVASATTGDDYRSWGRTPERMGIAGLDRAGLLRHVRGDR